MEDKKIAIVTVLYKSADVLEAFYDSLSKQTYKNFVLYAVDNKSPDASLQVITDLAAKADFETVIIEADDNGGAAKGNNIGLKRALADGCDLILMVNNDIEFEPDAISLLVEGLDKYDCDLIVPKIFNYFTGKLWSTGGDYGYTRPTYTFGAREDDAPRYNVPRRLKFAPTTFMLIKPEVFEAVGLLDERYFAYFEDTDFIWRAVMERGFRLHYEPKAVVQHKAGTSSGSKASPFTFYINTRNRAYFMNKYYPWYQRLCVNAHEFTYYFLYTIKHPSFPSIFKNIGYYREGLRFYRDWLKEQKGK